MHVHAGVIDVAVMFAMLLVLSAAWRTASAHLADRPIGQAMAYCW